MNTAYIGLVEAVRHYDSGKVVNYSTYTAHWIRQAIRQYLTKSGFVRIPSNMKALIFRYKRFLSAYKSDYAGLLPPDEEIRHELHIGKKQLANLKKYAFSNRIASPDNSLDGNSLDGAGAAQKTPSRIQSHIKQRERTQKYAPTNRIHHRNTQNEHFHYIVVEGKRQVKKISYEKSKKGLQFPFI